MNPARKTEIQHMLAEPSWRYSQKVWRDLAQELWDQLGLVEKARDEWMRLHDVEQAEANKRANNAEAELESQGKALQEEVEHRLKVEDERDRLAERERELLAEVARVDEARLAKQLAAMARADTAEADLAEMRAPCSKCNDIGSYQTHGSGGTHSDPIICDSCVSGAEVAVEYVEKLESRLIAYGAQVETLEADLAIAQEREQKAISILTHAVDDIDKDDLLELCRRLELDCDAEHERAEAAEAEVAQLKAQRAELASAMAVDPRHDEMVRRVRFLTGYDAQQQPAAQPAAVPECVERWRANAHGRELVLEDIRGWSGDDDAFFNAAQLAADCLEYLATTPQQALVLAEGGGDVEVFAEARRRIAMVEDLDAHLAKCSDDPAVWAIVHAVARSLVVDAGPVRALVRGVERVKTAIDDGDEAETIIQAHEVIEALAAVRAELRDGEGS